LLERFTSIFDYAKAIISILDLSELLIKTTDVITKITSSKGCLIRLYEDGEFKIKYVKGIPDGLMNILNQNIGKIIPEYVSRSGYSLLIEDTSRLPDGLPPQLKVFRLMCRSILCVPLKKDSVVTGTIELFDKEAINAGSFTTNDVQTTEGVSVFASLSIDKSRIYQEVTQTKDRLLSLVQDSADAIITTDTHGVITSWNRSAERIYGFSTDEAIGQIIPVLPDTEDDRDLVKRLLDGETLKDIEAISKKKDGNIINTSLTMSPMRNANSEIFGISIIARDITRRKSIEDELIRSNIESARLFEKVSFAEAELKNIFESISDLVYIIDTNYTILKVNRAVCNLVGMPMNEIVGKKCFEVFHNTIEPWEKCLHRKTLENKRSYINEIDGFYYKTDEIFGMSNSPILDSKEDILGTVHIVRNITELKKLTAQLASFEKMAMLGEVAAGVAHSIRNPLVSIGGFAKRLSQKLEPPYSEYADIIQTEAQRLEELLKRTLGFAHSAKTSMEVVDLNTLIRSLIHLAKIDGNIEIIDELNETQIEVIGDTARLRDGISNILKNAIQSIEDKGRIMIRSYMKEGFGVIEIEDNGIGFKKDAVKHIFDPFYTTKPDGTGLGLAITHKIIMEHMGSIDVVSEPGTGTIFTIRIPLKEVLQNDEDINS